VLCCKADPAANFPQSVCCCCMAGLHIAIMTTTRDYRTLVFRSVSCMCVATFCCRLSWRCGSSVSGSSTTSAWQCGCVLNSITIQQSTAWSTRFGRSAFVLPVRCIQSASWIGRCCRQISEYALHLSQCAVCSFVYARQTPSHTH